MNANPFECFSMEGAQDILPVLELRIQTMFLAAQPQSFVKPS